MLTDETVFATEAQAVPPPSPRRILIVDDDPQQVEVLSYRLGKLGYRTLTAHRGTDAVHLAQSSRPHLVLLDVGLPDVDGLEVCQQLTDNETTCGIPVIVLSGLESPDIVRRSRGAGCQYYLCKPYDPNALLVLVENALDGAE